MDHYFVIVTQFTGITRIQLGSYNSDWDNYYFQLGSKPLLNPNPIFRGVTRALIGGGGEGGEGEYSYFVFCLTNFF